MCVCIRYYAYHRTYRVKFVSNCQCVWDEDHYIYVSILLGRLNQVAYGICDDDDDDDDDDDEYTEHASKLYSMSTLCYVDNMLHALSY